MFPPTFSPWFPTISVAYKQQPANTAVVGTTLGPTQHSSRSVTWRLFPRPRDSPISTWVTSGLEAKGGLWEGFFNRNKKLHQGNLQHQGFYQAIKVFVSYIKGTWMKKCQPKQSYIKVDNIKEFYKSSTSVLPGNQGVSLIKGTGWKKTTYQSTNNQPTLDHKPRFASWVIGMWMKPPLSKDLGHLWL